MATTAQDVIICSVCRVNGVSRYCGISNRALCESCEEEHLNENGGHFVTDFSSRNDAAEKTEGECWVPPVLNKGNPKVNDVTNASMYVPLNTKDSTQKEQNEKIQCNASTMDSLILHKKRFPADNIPIDNEENATSDLKTFITMKTIEGKSNEETQTVDAKEYGHLNKHYDKEDIDFPKSWTFYSDDVEKLSCFENRIQLYRENNKIKLKKENDPISKLTIALCDKKDVRTSQTIINLIKGLENVQSSHIIVGMAHVDAAKQFVKDYQRYSFVKLFLSPDSREIRTYGRVEEYIDAVKMEWDYIVLMQEMRSEYASNHNRNPLFSARYHLDKTGKKIHSKLHLVCTTEEQLNIFVYCDSILNADVEVIVNVASEDLDHRAGLAAFIAKAAGHKLIEDSKTCIAKYGKLKVTQVALTSPGNLHFRFVLHVIRPKWKKYLNKIDCLSDLKQAILNALEMAQRKGAMSIAFPVISAEGFEVPKELTAEIYAASFHQFSQDNGLKRSIRDIHFVDIDPDMVQKTRKAFENIEKSKNLLNIATIKKKYPHIQWTTPSSSERTQKLKKFSQFDDPKQISPEYENVGLFEVNRQFILEKLSGKSGAKLIKLPDTTIAHIPVKGFQFNNGLIVKIYTGSIVKFHGDAIVIRIDPTPSGSGFLRNAVRKAGGQEYEKEFERMRRLNYNAKLGDALHCKGGTLGAKNVLHLVLHPLSPTRDRSFEEYKFYLVRALDEISAQSWEKVAFPLIGAGLMEKDMSDLQNCCLAWFSVFSDFASKREHTCHVGEIHLINHNPRVTSFLIEAFEINSCVDVSNSAHSLYFRCDSGIINKRHGREDRRESERKYNHFSEDFSTFKTKSFSWGRLRQSEEERLQILNSVKGNQPENGTMNWKIDASSSLPGYERHGTIIIKYNFPNGIQGPEHPNPGQPYEGTERKAYLPDNTEGQKVLRLLQKAFDRRLTFTIGSSLTTGRDNVIIWNGILHKTQRNTGAQGYGYPDPTYLKSVQFDLALKGVTE